MRRRAGFAGGSRHRPEPAYPSQTIKMIVPYPAGGTTDLLGRMVAEQLQTGLGATVIVENKPGAGTTLGAEQVARSAPDGYTLLLATSTTLAINKTLYKQSALRSGEGFHADRAGGRRAVRADRQSGDPGQDAGRIHRLCQIEAGTGLWLGRQWQPAASRRRDAEDRRGHRGPSRRLSRQRAGDAGRDRGAHFLHGGGSAAGAAADPRRQGQGARRHHAEARRCGAGYSDAGRKRASRVSNWWPGRAWSAPAGLPRPIVDQLAAQIGKAASPIPPPATSSSRSRWSRCRPRRRTALRLTSRPKSIAGPSSSRIRAPNWNDASWRSVKFFREA